MVNLPANIQSVLNELLYYVRSNEPDLTKWYVGISSDPLETLITRHLIDEEKDVWVYRQCLTHEDAKTVVSHFVNNLGLHGGTKTGTGEGGKFVYLYRKNLHSRP